LGERDSWLHEDRSEEEQKINGGGERFRGEEERAFGRRVFGRRESESFRKSGYLVARIVEIGIVNRE
jgi:hypothetical protein